MALGAGLTVILATLTSLPASTTHGLRGALLGAGLAAVGAQANFVVLGSAVFLPLLISPLAMMLASGDYRSFQRFRGPLSTMAVDTPPHCAARYTGGIVGLDAQTALNAAHYLSAEIVSFARGLNDTLKIAALLLATQALDAQPAIVAVAIAIAAGGWLNARKVAETMSRKITPPNHRQGLVANFVTSALVILASAFGLPVSTTHVSVGALFGLASSPTRAIWVSYRASFCLGS